MKVLSKAPQLFPGMQQLLHHCNIQKVAKMRVMSLMSGLYLRGSKMPRNHIDDAPKRTKHNHTLNTTD